MKRWSGENLKEIRGKRNQTSLAAGLQHRGFGTTQTQVSRWEAGQRPRRYIVEAIAAELGCKVDELFDNDDEESESDLDAVLTRQAVASIARATVAETVAETLKSLGINA
jgi:transcriptional regulator with XRE-family HTH domain